MTFLDPSHRLVRRLRHLGQRADVYTAEQVNGGDGGAENVPEFSLEAVEVRIVACGLVMGKTGVAAGDVIDGIDTAPNGFNELFPLQDQGQETLQL